MPRVDISMMNGEHFVVREMRTENVADLVDDFQEPSDSPVITVMWGEFGLNDVVHLNRMQVSSITVEGMT